VLNKTIFESHYFIFFTVPYVHKVLVAVLDFVAYISRAVQMRFLRLSLASYCLIQIPDSGTKQAKSSCWSRDPWEWLFQITGWREKMAKEAWDIFSTCRDCHITTYLLIF